MKIWCCPVCFYKWLAWSYIFELMFLRQLEAMARHDPFSTLLWLRYVAPVRYRER